MDFTSLAISSPLNVVNSAHTAQKGMFLDFSEIPSSSPLNVVNSAHTAQKGMFWDSSESELQMSHVSVSSVNGTVNHTPEHSLNILA